MTKDTELCPFDCQCCKFNSRRVENYLELTFSALMLQVSKCNVVSSAACIMYYRFVFMSNRIIHHFLMSHIPIMLRCWTNRECQVTRLRTQQASGMESMNVSVTAEITMIKVKRERRKEEVGIEVTACLVRDFRLLLILCLMCATQHCHKRTGIESKENRYIPKKHHVITNYKQQ